MGLFRTSGLLLVKQHIGAGPLVHGRLRLLDGWRAKVNLDLVVLYNLHARVVEIDPLAPRASKGVVVPKTESAAYMHHDTGEVVSSRAG